MKAIFGIFLLSTLFFTSFASAKTDVLICSIGDSYTFKVFLKENMVDLWEMAASTGRPIDEDRIIKAEQGSGTLKITTKRSGIIDLDFNNIYKEGRGTWAHNGTLDELLYDEPDYNVDGVAHVQECYFEVYN